MAPPKRGRHSEASGSHPRSPPVSSPEYETSDDDSGYDREKFISEAAFEEYKRLMEKTVIKERGFVPVSTDGNLVAMIERMGWVAVCETPLAVPLSIVREFYANAKADMDGSAMVRGVIVDYSPVAISRLLELPPKPARAEDWAQKARSDVDLGLLIVEMCVPGTVWTRARNGEEYSFPAAALNKFARAWFYFVCSNLSPNMRSHVVTVVRAILLYGILNEQYLDLGWLMYQNMRRCMRAATSGAIPHASVVARLCSAAGVRWGADEPVQQPMGDIDSALIQRLVEWPGGTPHPSGLGYIVGDESPPHRGGRGRRPRAAQGGRVGSSRAGRGDGAGTSRGAGGSSSQAGGSGMSDSQYRRLIRRIDTSHIINRQSYDRLTTALSGIYLEHGIDAVLPPFGVGSVYPPPDSPPSEHGDSDDE